MQFPRLKKFVYLFLATLLGLGATAHGQLNYTTNWVGNSFGGNNGSNNMLHVPDYLDGLYVTSNGEVYTNGNWDEGGRALNIYQNGQIISTYNDNVPDGMGVAADSNYIYASNAPRGTGVTLVTQSTMADASQTLTGSSTLGNSYDIYQLVIWNGNLYVAEDDQNVVDVFSTSNYALTKSYSISDPAHIAVDSNGNLWVSHMDHSALPSINGIVSDNWGDFGKNTIDEYNSGGSHVQTLTLGSGVQVRALWIDSNNNLYIGDQGANENILVYNNLSGTPILSKTLGLTGGFLGSSTPGVVSSSSSSSATFYDITGIGTDSSGNIYVGDDGYGQGTDVFSFSSSGSLNWQVSNQEFLATGAVDPSSETDYYDAYHHFKLNYNNAPGNLGTYYANTVNPFKYPGDPRITQTMNTGRVQYIQGHKFLLASNQAGSIFAIYRFNAGSETAIPCTVFDYGSFNNEYVDLYGEPSNGEFIWYDSNGDGQVQSNEFLQPSNAQFGNGNSWWMDTNGDVWEIINSTLRRYIFQGFDSYGTPLYNYNNIDTYTGSDSSAITNANKAVFQTSESQYGTLYLAGSGDGTAAYSQVTRIDNWENGNRTAAWSVSIPYNDTTLITNSFAETNGYFFVDYNVPHYISVYSTANGSYVGEFDAGTDVGGDANIGNDDEWQSMSVYERSNGEYVVTKEEDYQAKLLLYVWTPSGGSGIPSAPTANAATSITSSGFTANWSSSSGATGYYLDVSTNSGFSSFVSGYDNLSVGNVTSNAVTGLTAGTTYYYRVRATNSSGTSGSSNTITVSTSGGSAPPAPTANAASSITSSGFTANWSSSSGTTGYYLDVSTSSSFSSFVSGYNNLSVGNVTSYAVAGLSASTAYYYRVRASNSSGTSGNSNTITVTTSASGGGTAVVEINAGGPAVSGTNWVADTDYSGGTGETWSNSINTSNVTNPAPIAVYQSDHFAYSVSSFTYTIPGLSSGTSYTVRLHFCENYWTAAGDRVFNVSINGTSVLSNFDVYATAGGKGIANIQQFTATANSSGQIVIVFTTVTDNAMVSGIEIDTAGSAPSAPVASAATSITSTGFTTNWAASTGATGYYIDVSTSSTFASFVSGYNNLSVGNVTSYAVTGLSANTTYYYRVRASNSSGTSGNSSTITATTSGAAPAAPVASAATSITSSGFTSNWAASTGATGYYLDVSTNSGFSSFVSGYNNLSVGNVTSYAVTGLTAGTTYYYRVRATNSSGTSGNSSTITVATIPSAPTASAATSITSSGFTSNWAASTGANGYYLDVSTSSSFSSFVSGYNNLSAGNVTTYAVSGLSASTTYYYRVRASNSGGTSGNSSTITVTTSASGGSTPVVEIDAGGAAVSGTNWVADTDYSGGAGETWTNSINTSNVTNPAPTAVYQSDHFANGAGSFTYTIPGLTANARYTVRLHFCEDFWTAAGDRVFNVSINGTSVLSNFDVYATAGGKGIANIQQFTATANSSGQIVIVFTTVTDNAMVSGIEIDTTSGSAPAAPTANAATSITSTGFTSNWTASTGATGYYLDVSTSSSFASFVSGYNNLSVGNVTSYAVSGLSASTTYYYRVRASNSSGTSGNSNTITAATTALTAVVEINTGGAAVSGTNWVADTDYSGGAGETWTNTITTTGLTNPAPTAVYQSDHFANGASSFTYTIPGLTAGAAYTVRLHFCEDFWTAAGDRVFNVSINGTSYLSNFDVFKTAGAKGTAIIEQTTTTANSSGQIVIVFTTVTDNAMVNGIEIDH